MQLLLNLETLPNEAKWELKSLLEELEGESDRAAAIVGAAWMDELVLELLETFMVPHPDTGKLLGKDSFGTLTNATSRVRLAFCLGLLGEEEKENLLLIAKIRNLFAHRIHRASFDNQKVYKLCEKLNIGKRLVTYPDTSTPRQVFIATVGTLAYVLGIRIKQVEPNRRQLLVKKDPTSP